MGIDLAWSPRNPSGYAALCPDGQVLEASSSPAGDDEVLGLIERLLPGDQPGIVAIDAPLAVPNESGGRQCDQEVASVFARFQAAPYPANRKNLSRYGGLRAEAIRRRLEASGYRHSPIVEPRADARQVIEVFPHPATVSLFGLDITLKYKARQGRTYPLRWRELDRLRDGLYSLRLARPPLHMPPDLMALQIEGTRGRELKHLEDLLDAIVCAYSALYAWYHGPRGYAAYGRGALVDEPEAAHILVPMTPGGWQRIRGDRLLFLDRDGTLNRSLGDRPPNEPSEVELLPGVWRRLHHRASLGWRLVIITNQGGVAFGYRTHRQAWSTHQAVLDALPVEVEANYLCPHHPEGTDPVYATTCPQRKPGPGAILDALARFGSRPGDCLFVGDHDTDRQAAEAAGVPFAWAWEFFATDPPAHGVEDGRRPTG
ncbi:MAG: HAD-IIIA family hydrolase [Anaerolineae bacterium]|nr:HAD-IIIA family hydrolase [Anaerolineae bacterium]